MDGWMDVSERPEMIPQSVINVVVVLIFVDRSTLV